MSLFADNRAAPPLGTHLAVASRQQKLTWERVSARRSVAHYIQDLHLVSVLDELREAYELCKDHGRPELQSLLMQVRRKLIEALHQSLDLYSENAELIQQLSQARAEITRLRATGAHPELPVETASGRPLRKLS